MAKSIEHIMTKEIINFVKNSTKLNLEPLKGIIGYNHLIRQGTSKKPITTDIAHYLLINDLNKITESINKYIEVELSIHKFCALVSYVHSTHKEPTSLFLADINLGLYKLASERLFENKREPKETRALRLLELRLWNNENDYLLNLNLDERIGKLK